MIAGSFPKWFDRLRLKLVDLARDWLHPYDELRLASRRYNRTLPLKNDPKAVSRQWLAYRGQHGSSHRVVNQPQCVQQLLLSELRHWLNHQ